MKKLNLQLGSIKEMLTKEQMKKVSGGYDCFLQTYDCWSADPVTGLFTVPAGTCTFCAGAIPCGWDDPNVVCQ
jgi:hypothetical protein